jgi:UDP-N-acetylmuramyl pentapeptide phosphotransferase/UDP-N-acetylglucosamine-1-phosphate transferase
MAIPGNPPPDTGRIAWLLPVAGVGFLFVVIPIAVATYLLGFPAAIILARLGAVDKPNARSSHLKPVVRGGGVAMAGGALLLVFCGFPLSWGVTSVMLLSALGIGVVSFCDDLKSVGAAIRFGCHSVAAIAALVALPLSSLHFGGGSSGCPLPIVHLLWLLGFLWIAGYTNTFNFMDGINGLAAGQAVITGFGMALLGSLTLHAYHSAAVLWSLAIASAALGFLPHNFPQARMFMGDVGSAPLGFCLAFIALWLTLEAGFWLLIPLVLLHANFVLDTSITFVRRIFRGECWHDAHREHFYQRLIRSGKTHAFVTGLEMALQAVVLGLMVLYLFAGTPIRVGLATLVVLLWLAFFAYCERSFRRSNLRAEGLGHRA